MGDPLRGKYTQCRHFGEEFGKAKDRLAPLGGVVSPGVHDYEAFTYESSRLRLVFYPHKTSAGNHHIRVRTVGKFDRAELRKALIALAENSCTFQFPADVHLHNEAMMIAMKRATP
jgi:hypothetical protein